MKIKNLFLDNNVIIGYVYKLDSLNPPSEDIVNSNHNLYYSYHVKLEVDTVSIRKNEEYRKFFTLLLSKLRKHKDTQFISRTSFHLFIEKTKPISKLSIENMHYALDCIWDTLNFGENQEVSQIKIKLRDFIISFGESHASRKTKFIKIAQYIPAHRHKDTQVCEMIKVKKLKDILHDEDEKILFDLHEYNKNHQELNLVFVSWDKKFINVIESLLEVLSFNEYISLE